MFLIIGLILTVFGLIFLEPILIFFGASPDIFPYSKDYLRIILIGSTFLAIGTGMNNFIRAEGNPRLAMVTMLIGTVTNIILNYLFIFPFNWGIKGAALATIVSYFVTSTWVLFHFFQEEAKLKLKKKTSNYKKNSQIYCNNWFPCFHFTNCWKHSTNNI